jgi:ABC-type sugar transport system substrate-binding protein
MKQTLRIKKIVTVLVAVLALFAINAALFAGSESEEKATGGKKLVVGFSQNDTNNPWGTAETESVKSEAAKRGIELKYADAMTKQANQIKAIRAFIAQDVDAIFLAPQVETGWEPVLKEAKAAGIPVFLLDRGVDVTDGSLYVTLLASDFVFEGEEAGKWLAKEMNYKGNIVELQGTPGASPTIDRKKGFENIINKYPDLKIIKSQTAEYQMGKGKELMEAFLKAEGQNIDAVYAHNDAMALGAIQAIEEYGLKPSEDIIIVSVDAIKDAFEAMVAGKLNCTVECTPLLGPGAFDALEKYLAGEKLPKWIKSEDQVFTKDTAAAHIGSRKY